jgi:cytoskeletal protein CcmA (bactofilin family)
MSSLDLWRALIYKCTGHDDSFKEYYTMAMWKKSDAEEIHFTPPPPPVVPPRTTVPQPKKERAMIGPTIFIKGDLTGEEDLIIEGRVEGKIQLKEHNVIIGKHGRVQADIFGKVISIEGEVQGNLRGEEQVLLRPTSTVRGNLTAPRVVLEDGANFKGSIDMCPKEANEPGPSPESAEAPGASKQ